LIAPPLKGRARQTHSYTHPAPLAPFRAARQSPPEREPHRRPERGRGNGQAAAEPCRPVEHQLRLFRYPDRLCAAERQYEPHLPVAGGGYRETARAVGRGAAHRAAGPTGDRPYERPHLARPPWPP